MEQRPIKHIINEIQLVLAEKRTALAVLRTGIAIFALPLSVLTVLVATSRYYDILEILGLFIPLLLVCVGLAIFGVGMMLRSTRNIRRYDRMVDSLLDQSDYLKSLLGEARLREEQEKTDQTRCRQAAPPQLG
jgi:uncharacterized membrane protein YidH (DUF202 family)